jgi:hypothetical protein
MEGEFICYADRASDEAVFVNIDENGCAESFSTETGDYEWTGPACIRKDKIDYSHGNVFNQLEPFLPIMGLKIRAYDIDTYQDYVNVSKIVSTWDI